MQCVAVYKENLSSENASRRGEVLKWTDLSTHTHTHSTLHHKFRPIFFRLSLFYTYILIKMITCIFYQVENMIFSNRFYFSDVSFLNEATIHISVLLQIVFCGGWFWFPIRKISKFVSQFSKAFVASPARVYSFISSTIQLSRSPTAKKRIVQNDACVRLVHVDRSSASCQIFRVQYFNQPLWNVPGTTKSNW